MQGQGGADEEMGVGKGRKEEKKRRAGGVIITQGEEGQWQSRKEQKITGAQEESGQRLQRWGYANGKRDAQGATKAVNYVDIDKDIGPNVEH